MPRYGRWDRKKNGTMVHIQYSCKKSELPAVCHGCGFIADLLCDYPITKTGKTCDRPMCTKCAHRMGTNLDYCQAHYEMVDFSSKDIDLLWKRWKLRIISYLQEKRPEFVKTSHISADLHMTYKECSEILEELRCDRRVFLRNLGKDDWEWRWQATK